MQPKQETVGPLAREGAVQLEEFAAEQHRVECLTLTQDDRVHIQSRTCEARVFIKCNHNLSLSLQKMFGRLTLPQNVPTIPEISPRPTACGRI